MVVYDRECESWASKRGHFDWHARITLLMDSIVITHHSYRNPWLHVPLPIHNTIGQHHVINASLSSRLYTMLHLNGCSTIA